MVTAQRALHDRPESFGSVPRQPALFRLVDQVGNSDLVGAKVANHPDHIGVDAARRARLVAGLAPWANARPQYRLTLGGALLPFTVLSDAALADLRARIAGDVRRERSLRRG